MPEFFVVAVQVAACAKARQGFEQRKANQQDRKPQGEVIVGQPQYIGHYDRKTYYGPYPCRKDFRGCENGLLPVLEHIMVDLYGQPSQRAESLHRPAAKVKIKQQEKGNKQDLGDGKGDTQYGYLECHYPDNGFI
jgi:hypothetical protein